MPRKSDRARVVLLVGDDAGGSGFVRDMLFDADREGYRLQQVGTAAEAIKLLRSVEVDIILIHLDPLERHPVEEVNTVYAAVGQTPIVVLTETTDERLARQCIDAGAQDCLLKHEIRPHIMRRTIDYGIARMRRTHMQAVGRLAAGVAHHFNNIFTVVMGNVDLVLHNVADERDRARLTEALRAARLSGELSRKLLGFAGLLPLRPEIVFPNPYLADVVALLRQCMASNITLVTDLPGDLWPVAVDPDELRTALFNLVSNASEAMPWGGAIRLSAANELIRDGRLGLLGRYLVITLRDAGVGIPPRLLPRIVDPFFTTKDIGGNCGLGLSQVHGFAQQSRGAIDIETSPGKGTTVKLFLPSYPSYAAMVASALTDRRRQPEVHRATTIEAGATVLVIKDDIEAATAVVEMLWRSGFATEVVRDAVAALDLLERGEQVDLVLSDIAMPDGVSGIEFAQVVQEHFPPVVVLFTTADSVLASNAATKGLHVVTRPYGPDELCGRIADLVRASKARRAQGSQQDRRRLGTSTLRGPADRVPIGVPRPASSPTPPSGIYFV
jgi:signal transduction histidine kinase